MHILDFSHIPSVNYEHYDYYVKSELPGTAVELKILNIVSQIYICNNTTYPFSVINSPFRTPLCCFQAQTITAEVVRWIHLVLLGEERQIIEKRKTVMNYLTDKCVSWTILCLVLNGKNWKVTYTKGKVNVMNRKNFLPRFIIKLSLRLSMSKYGILRDSRKASLNSLLIIMLMICLQPFVKTHVLPITKNILWDDVYT